MFFLSTFFFSPRQQCEDYLVLLCMYVRRDYFTDTWHLQFNTDFEWLSRERYNLAGIRLAGLRSPCVWRVSDRLKVRLFFILPTVEPNPLLTGVYVQKMKLNSDYIRHNCKYFAVRSGGSVDRKISAEETNAPRRSVKISKNEGIDKCRKNHLRRSSTMTTKQLCNHVQRMSNRRSSKQA